LSDYYGIGKIADWPPALATTGAPLGWDENTNPIGGEFGEVYSHPGGYYPNSITQFTVTSAPRPILFGVGETVHARYFSEDVFAAAGQAKELFIVPQAGHVALYDRGDGIPFDRREAFFTGAVA
jgi:fermentation-respiration switch protein FrsA (DUF1100 family)